MPAPQMQPQAAPVVEDAELTAADLDTIAAAGVVKTGAGKLDFGGANTYAGTTTVAQGVLL